VAIRDHAQLPGLNYSGVIIRMGDIRVGTSSFADRRLLASGWYPREVDTPAARLRHYAERFDLVEVDTTRYAVPAVETTTTWAAATPAGFTFDVTAFGLLTGHPTRVSALPADLRPTGPGVPGTVRRKDLDPAVWRAIWDRFHEAVEPIAAAGKLGALLLRFPAWFARGDAAARRILATADEAGPHRVAVDLRHPSWFAGGNALETLLFLQEHGIGFCCVEAPSTPAVIAASAEPAIVRFEGHGRDTAAGSPDRFRHTHTDGQLNWWVNCIRKLAEDVDELHVLVDNCCGDQGPRDAARLAAALGRDALGRDALGRDALSSGARVKRAPATTSGSARAR
jgi:uncharacterized protein YecE (DUF72 family)